MIEKNTSKAEIWKSIRMNILIASAYTSTK